MYLRTELRSGGHFYQEDTKLANVKLTVDAGPHRRINCPVSTTVDAPEGVTDVKLTLDEVGVPCQARLVEGGLHVSWIIDDLSANEASEYVLEFSGEGQGPGVSLSDNGDEVEVKINGEHFTSYRFGKDLVRPHLYPVIGPYGDGVTRRLIKEGEADHHHHRSIWISHGHVNGWNNWAEGEGHAWTRHQEFEALESGPVYGRIVAIGNWEGAEEWRGEHGSNVICQERAEWTFYNTPADMRVIDLHLTLTAPKIDVLFGDTKEGGLASVRVEETMDVKAGLGGQIENGMGGRNEDETWGKQAPWCDYSGPVNGKRVGIAIMDHPDSFRYPTYWHVRNYGLMTANPFGLSHFYGDPEKRGNYVLEAEKSLIGIYRFYIHTGDATEGQVGERYHDFAHPPKVVASGA